MNSLATRTPSQLVTRTKIDTLEETLREEISKGAMGQTVVDCQKDNSQADHYYGQGVYARSLLIPAGTVVVGKIHKQDRVCIIASGECTFIDEWQKKRVKAPYIGEFKAGSKTAVFAHTDTTWVACIGTESKDPDIMVHELVESNHEDYQVYLEQLED